MTRKVFWEDPYLTHLDTHITSIHNADVTVADTIFYAFSGGQESDEGTIGGRRVLQARKEGKEIVYTLEPGHSLQLGDPVTMAIDWTRRYQLMRLHFAAEIILELVYQTLDSIEKIGAHIAQNKSRIDFKWNENISSIFPTIQDRARALIEANYDIFSAYSDEANEKRYWEISGFARVPCGGTHLKKTGEVGALTLKRKNVGKGKERLEIFLSD
jgi:Ser-tRNA(Ala) deacylase AlaX